MSLKNLNLYLGLLLFIGFLITGYYMKTYFKPEHIENIAQRLQIRSNHIYILFIALLNVVAFKSSLDDTSKAVRYLEASFRVLLILAGLVAVVAFCVEHTGDISDRRITLVSIVLSLTSIGLLLLGMILSKLNTSSIG